MDYKINNDTLVLFLEGELNSTNADIVEKEIEDILKSQTFKTLYLDFNKITYISSAGLRVVLKLKQKYADVHIIGTSLEVYDVFQMTGFTNIMDVQKALKNISVEGAEIIGEGFFSTVYRIDKDTIIKVFNRTSDEKQIERELKLAKQAFVLGIPTAISFDIVRVGDKLGVRFEMLDCMSLQYAFLRYPEKYDKLILEYTKLLKKINETDCMDYSLPDCKAFYLKKVELIKQVLTESEYKQCKKLIEGIPEAMTFVHGDCHFKNIMVQRDDLLLIDMDTLSRGAPIFELAALRCPYICFEEDDPGNCERFLGASPELCTKIYNDLIFNYFGKDDPVIKEKIALLSYIHMIWWTLTNTPNDSKRLNGCKGRLLKLLNKYDNLDI